jgi:signal recognition particle subunit SEC65
MSPLWRRKLRQHEGKTLVELCRRPRIKERITGFIVGYSDNWILLHRLDWNAFVLDGYSLVRHADVENLRIFSRRENWPKRAVEKLRLLPKRIVKVSVENLADAIVDISKKFPLIHVERELKYPGECWIGYPFETKSQKLVLENLDHLATWTGHYSIMLKDITRVDFGGGYERALALTAPSRPRRRKP